MIGGFIPPMSFRFFHNIDGAEYEFCPKESPMVHVPRKWVCVGTGDGDKVGDDNENVGIRHFKSLV